VGAVAVAALWLGLSGCRANDGPRPIDLRGVWVQGRSLQTKEQVDAVLDRAQAGRFNTIFAGVFGDGRTVYPSRLTDQNEKIAPGFDPLAYLVPEAHRRNIQVHAWFSVGRIGDETGSPILARYPEWGLVGPDGETIAWLNFTRPDARQFVADLMLDVVERYKVDGLHFDYTRYPGAEWGFDAYSRDAFRASSGLDLNQLRYADLPAYGLFEANALSEPDTAEVLATFANGWPAVTLNQYGQGEVVVLNWQANERTVAAGAEILQRSLRRLLGSNGQVYLLRSKTNAEEYGDVGFTNVATWLHDLGWQPVEVAETDVSALDADSVLVMPNVYLISDKTAGQLADFVRQGGGVIFIDGPTRAIGQADIQAITGMKARGDYFSEWTLLTATGEHPLIPTSQREADLSTYQRLDAQWKEFRAQGVSAVIQEVYQRVRAQHPEVIVSATITSDQQQAAQANLQDWQAWLRNGTIDVLIPRAYVNDIEDLPAVLETWQPAVQEYGRVVFGVIDFVENGKADEPKPPHRLLAEIELAQAAGTNGVMIFDLDRMSDEQLQALADGPFAVLTQAIGQ
jgi:uncharacterized lipoprotein YddW (UPF0748 family)